MNEFRKAYLNQSHKIKIVALTEHSENTMKINRHIWDEYELHFSLVFLYMLHSALSVNESQ